MMEVCGDNRFEIIANAKADLLECTNIETNEAEMDVIDNILFRCWQMGWLDKYDRKTEPQTETEIAKAIVHKMIDEANIAEDAYPDLRKKMHDAVEVVRCWECKWWKKSFGCHITKPDDFCSFGERSSE